MEGVTAEDRDRRFNVKSELNTLFTQLNKRRQHQIEKIEADSLRRGRQTLDEAVDLVGECMDYCPYFEKVERHKNNEVKRPEMRPGTNEPDYSRMVKAFVRPTETSTIKLPEEIRPPEILRKTCDYLFRELLPNAVSWISVHEFIFNRTRAIRQDITIQNNHSALAVECNELIARFHILSFHESKIHGRPEEDWERELRSAYDGKLEAKQLNGTLSELTQHYDNLRGQGMTFPNEPEFRAYQFLLADDQNASLRLERLPADILRSPWIQMAIDLNNLTNEHNSKAPTPKCTSYALTRLLKLTQEPTTPFLFAAIIETKLPALRTSALRAMAATILSRSTPVDHCMKMLGFETADETIEFLRQSGLKLEGDARSLGGAGKASVVLHRNMATQISKPVEKKLTEINQSAILIAKRGTWAWTDIIEGKLPPPIPRVSGIETGLLPAMPIRNTATLVRAPAASNVAGPSKPSVSTPAFAAPTPGSAFAFGAGGSSASARNPFGASSAAFGANGAKFGGSSAPKPAFGGSQTSALGAAQASAFGASLGTAFNKPLTTSSSVSTIPAPMPAFGFGLSASSTTSPAPSPFSFSRTNNLSTNAVAGPSTLSAMAKEFVPSFGIGLGFPGAAPPSTTKFEPKPSRAAENAVHEATTGQPKPKERPRRPTISTSVSPLPLPPMATSPILVRKPSISVPPVADAKVKGPIVVPKTPIPPSPDEEKIQAAIAERNSAMAQNILHLMLRATSKVDVATAFAEAWHDRKVRRAVLKIWYKRMGSVKEKKREEEARRKEKEGRWGRLMHSLNGKEDNLDGSTNGRKKGKGKAIPDKPGPYAATVEEMEMVVEKANRQREIMWAPDTFLDVVRHQVGPEGVGSGWALWVVGSGPGNPTWQWLKVKLGIASGEGREVEVGVGVISLSSDIYDYELEARLYPGLVIFELSPLLDTIEGAERHAMWEAELQRLTNVVLDRIPRGQPYRPALLALYWGTAESSSDPYSEVKTKLEEHLEGLIPSLDIHSAVEVAVFTTPETYDKAFARSMSKLITHEKLDTSGKLVERQRFDLVLTNFMNVWEEATTGLLITCYGHKAEAPSVKWAALARAISISLEGLNALEQTVCDVLDMVPDDEPLPRFGVEGVGDEQSLKARVLEYLGRENVSGKDVLLLGLMGELGRRNDLPVRRVLDQIAWHVASRLHALGGTTRLIEGPHWKSACEQLKIDLRMRGESQLQTFVTEESGKAVKKRGRVMSSEREKKKIRSSLGPSNASEPTSLHDREPPPYHSQPPTSPPQSKSSDLIDLERLIAESEALLAGH